MFYIEVTMQSRRAYLAAGQPEVVVVTTFELTDYLEKALAFETRGQASRELDRRFLQGRATVIER